VLGIALTQVQNLALGFVELHEVCTGPSLKLVKVPLDGIPSHQCVNHTTQSQLDMQVLSAVEICDTLQPFIELFSSLHLVCSAWFSPLYLMTAIANHLLISGIC